MKTIISDYSLSPIECLRRYCYHYVGCIYLAYIIALTLIKRGGGPVVVVVGEW